MKRMNVMLDEKILSEVKEKTGADSYSAAINEALKQALYVASIRDFYRFVGSGIWEGDLEEMRRDSSRKPTKKKRSLP